MIMLVDASQTDLPFAQLVKVLEEAGIAAETPSGDTAANPGSPRGENHGH